MLGVFHYIEEEQKETGVNITDAKERSSLHGGGGGKLPKVSGLSKQHSLKKRTGRNGKKQGGGW